MPSHGPNTAAVVRIRILSGKTMAPASTNTRTTTTIAQGSPRTAFRTDRTLSAVTSAESGV